MSVDGLVVARQRLFRLDIVLLVWDSLTGVLDVCPPVKGQECGPRTKFVRSGFVALSLLGEAFSVMF